MTNQNWALTKHIVGDAGGFSEIWGLHLPRHHPVWAEYLLVLYDLGPRPGVQSAIKYREDVTHEIMMYALDPEKPIDKDQPIENQALSTLSPANHGYQFVAENDEAAIKRIQTLVDAMLLDKLSADTDFTPVWNELFQDGVTLKSEGGGESFALLVLGEPPEEPSTLH